MVVLAQWGHLAVNSYCGEVFPLSGPPPIQNWPPNYHLGTSSIGSQNGPLNPPQTYLGLKVDNLQILQIVDLPGMSTGSIMLFHNVDPELVH